MPTTPHSWPSPAPPPSGGGEVPNPASQPRSNVSLGFTDRLNGGMSARLPTLYTQWVLRGGGGALGLARWGLKGGGGAERREDPITTGPQPFSHQELFDIPDESNDAYFILAPFGWCHSPQAALYGDKSFRNDFFKTAEKDDWSYLVHRILPPAFSQRHFGKLHANRVLGPTLNAQCFCTFPRTSLVIHPCWVVILNDNSLSLYNKIFNPPQFQCRYTCIFLQTTFLSPVSCNLFHPNWIFFHLRQSR